MAGNIAGVLEGTALSVNQRGISRNEICTFYNTIDEEGLRKRLSHTGEGVEDRTSFDCNTEVLFKKNTTTLMLHSVTDAVPK